MAACYDVAMVRVLPAAAVLASFVGCAAPVTAPTEADRSRDAIAMQPLPRAAEPATNARPTIATLRLRDVDLTIASGPRGPLFAVTARDGSFAERDLGADDLAARHPALYQFYRSALARSPGAPYLDARLDTPRESDRGDRPRSR